MKNIILSGINAALYPEKANSNLPTKSSQQSKSPQKSSIFSGDITTYMKPSVSPIVSELQTIEKNKRKKKLDITTLSMLARKIAKENKTDEKLVFKYVMLACEIAEKYGVDEILVLAVIDTESKFINNSTSKAGAQGLMQLMPATARGLKVKDSMNPAQNIDGGVRLLKRLLKKYKGNIEHALAAYNWGEGNLDAYLRGEKKEMPKETREYIIKIDKTYKTIIELLN